MHRAMTFIAILSFGALAACASQPPVGGQAPVASEATSGQMVPNTSTLLTSFNTTVVMSPRSAQCLELQRVLEDPTTQTWDRQRAREDFNQQDCNYRSLN
jgi:hypothetical protein